ncbi:M56 family metallopeptidase [Runella sp.]|uniref:M56 family metallopeptidase n=1 Tax=Runella sp. TaxID=1960881 RepID=UPI003D13290E
MIIYLFKFAACSALLLILYHPVLEKEKMPVFNRYYLLFSIVFSGLVPLFTFELPVETASFVIEKASDLPSVGLSRALVSNEPVSVSKTVNTPNWQTYLWSIYGAITFMFLFRFGKNLSSFWKTIRTSPIVEYGTMKLVLTSQADSPYSFFRYVFVNQETFEQGEIEPEILRHEQAHVQQRHTLDVVFMELLLAFCWWNPAVWLYRKAVQLNHEFLADDWVIKTYQNSTAYQYLLLHKISQSRGMTLTSSFNYLLTKKRFKMMNKITSMSRVYALQTATAILFSVLVFAFGNVSFAQSAPSVVAKSTNEAEFSKDGVSQALLDEYGQIVARYLKKGVKNGKEWRRLDRPSEADRARLETIFKAMSKEQQAAQEINMHPPIGPLPRVLPTEKEFEAYKDAKTYGVWIDEKKVPNSVLNKYKASDFSQVFVSKLYKNAQATIGYKYKYQLDLMTTAYYEKYRSETLADKRYRLGYNFEKMK